MSMPLPVPSSSIARINQEEPTMPVQRRSIARLLGLATLASAIGVSHVAFAAKPLVHAIPSDIASLDPADIRGQQDQEIGVNVYERLVQMKFNEQKEDRKSTR